MTNYTNTIIGKIGLKTIILRNFFLSNILTLSFVKGSYSIKFIRGIKSVIFRH